MFHRRARGLGAVIGCLCFAFLSACRREEAPELLKSPRIEVRDPAMPAGVRWAPEDSRTPLTTLVPDSDTWRLRVDLRSAGAVVVDVLGPGPKFARIARLEIASDRRGERSHEVVVEKKDVPESARELIVVARYSDGAFAALQALLGVR